MRAIVGNHCYSHTDEEIQTARPGKGTNQAKERASNSKPSDLSFAFKLLAWPELPHRRAAPWPLLACVGVSLSPVPPHHPPATSGPISILTPECHLRIAELITILCFKSLQWLSIGRAHAWGSHQQVIRIYDNHSLGKWQVMKKMIDLGDMLYVGNKKYEKRLIWLWETGLNQ